MSKENLEIELQIKRDNDIAKAAQELFEAVNNNRPLRYFDDDGRLLPEIAQQNDRLVEDYKRKISKANSQYHGGLYKLRKKRL